MIVSSVRVQKLVIGASTHTLNRHAVHTRANDRILISSRSTATLYVRDKNGLIMIHMMMILISASKIYIFIPALFLDLAHSSKH